MNDLQSIKKLVQPACDQFGVQELSLFGSRARGNARDDSDYDFAVLFDRAQTGLLSDRFFGLLFFLEDQLNRSVDLLELDAIRNPFLREAIEEEKSLLYAARDTEAVL
ncbi:MAG: nucleotidyltransferase domain-containing protein [Chloroflexi bacterium]|nr:nucleotidyltransferase domain-containing protein [Chloroflexota bacterium]